MKRKQIIILLFLIILLGTFLRFYHIGKESFWLDESATALTLKKYSIGEIFHNTVVKGQILPGYYDSNLDLPPYYILIKIWSNLFGVSEVSLRSFSALFGFLAIPVIYFLSKELFNEKTGLIASFLFSLNVVMIEYSQEARLYNMLIFIVLLSAYFLIRSLKTNENKYVAGFFISNIAGVYTHYPFLFFVIFELVFMFILLIKEYLTSKKFKVSKIQVAALSLVIFYIPLVPRLLNPKFVSTHYIGKFSLGNLIRLFLQINTWFYPSQQLRDKLNSIQINLFLFSEWVLVVSVLFLAILLIIFVLRNFMKIKNINNNKLFLLLWLAIPSIAGFAVLYRSIMTFGSLKYFIFIVPAYLILAANGIATFKNKTIELFVLIVILLSIAPLCSYYTNPSKLQYREAVKFLEDNSNNKENIIVNLPSVIVPLNYYSDKLANVYGINNLEEAKKISSNSDSLWVIFSTKYADQDGKIKNFLDGNYLLLDSKHFYDVSIYHYSKK